MKIAFLSTFYPLRGGIAQFNAAMYRAFEQEHDVKAYTFKRQYPDFLFPGETQYVTEDDNVDKIDSLELLDTINPFSYGSTAKQIKAFNPDFLIMKYWMSFFGPSLGTVAKHLKTQTKVITILDNVIPHEKRFFDTPFTKYFLKQNHGFIAMSDAVQADLMQLTDGKAQCLRINHPNYDHFGANVPKSDAAKQLKLPPEKKTILFFGFIRDYKGLDLLIQAMDHLDDSFQLVIAGECYGSFEKYTRLIEKSTFKQNIHVFNQYIGDPEVPNFFCAADVVVLPYKSATQSGITAIAHHFAVPIIATDVGGLKEIITHKETGLIVPEVDSKAIADAIHIYFNKNYKIAFSKNLEAQKAENSWERFAEKVLSFGNQL